MRFETLITLGDVFFLIGFIGVWMSFYWQRVALMSLLTVIESWTQQLAAISAHKTSKEKDVQEAIKLIAAYRRQLQQERQQVKEILNNLQGGEKITKKNEAQLQDDKDRIYREFRTMPPTITPLTDQPPITHPKESTDGLE